jgi:plastocyanin
MSDFAHRVHVIIERERKVFRIIVREPLTCVFDFGALMKFEKWSGRQIRLSRRRRSGRLWVLGLLILQSSCGWGEPPAIVITAEEFRFTPTRIEWSAGHPLRLLIRNQGRERHVFHSQELFGPESAVTWHEPMVALQEAHAIVLEPGQSVELHVALPPGLYPFRCWIKGHTGMEGAILVKGISSG